MLQHLNLIFKMQYFYLYFELIHPLPLPTWAPPGLCPSHHVLLSNFTSLFLFFFNNPLNLMHRPYVHGCAGLHGSMVNPSEATAIKKMNCPSPNIPQLSVAPQLGMEPPKPLPPSMLERRLAWFCTKFCECNGSDTSREHCFAPLAFIVFHGGVSEPGREGTGLR